MAIGYPPARLIFAFVTIFLQSSHFRSDDKGTSVKNNPHKGLVALFLREEIRHFLSSLPI
jgi:hypothetical protein